MRPHTSAERFRLARRLAGLRARHRRLLRRLEARARLMALVSHDMREPLQALLGPLRDLSEEETDPRRRERLALCLQAAESLTTLVNDLLDVARAEHGRLVLHQRPFRLDGFLRRVVELVAPRARARGLHLGLTLDPTLPPVVRGDPARLRQILLNLLSNAVKYTRRGGVRLLAHRGGRGVRLVVEDTGRGLPPALRRPGAFRRGGEELPGTGLGLFIAHRLAGLLGGTLHLEETDGGGTRAVLDLPLAEVTVTPSDVPATPTSLMALVAAVETTSAALARALADAGVRVQETPDPEAALALAREAADAGAPPDLIAVAAPAATPAVLALARRLRRHPALVETRLVLQVAAGLRGDAAAAEAAGFDAYLAGPADGLPWARLLEHLAPGRPDRLLVAHDLVEGPRRPLRVLVVEDDPLNARLLALLLERLGHRVVREASGEDALARLAADPAVDVVLLDLQLPGMDGFAFVRRLRADPRLAALPVVAVTGAGLPEDRAACRAAGMAAFLAKPVERADLAAVLARVAGGG